MGNSNVDGMLGKTAFWVRMLLFRLFAQTRTDENWRDDLIEAGKDSLLVHVLDVRSFLDGMLLSYWLRKYSLAPVFVSNGFRAFLAKPLHLLLIWPFLRLFRLASTSKPSPDIFVNAVSEGRPGLLFMKNNRRLFSTGSSIASDYLEALIGLQKKLEKPILLVPQVVIWNMGVKRLKKNLLDLVFDSQTVSGIRRFWIFARNASHIRLSHASIINLKEVIEAAEEGSTDKDLASKVRFLLNREIGAELKVARGPLQKGAAHTVEEILANPEVSTAIDGIAAEAGASPARMHRKARRYLREIAADMKEEYVQAATSMLTPLFNRLFSGIVVDMSLLDSIRESYRKAPVVLVPSHRSHADYLILTYLLYYSGIVPPHIAAGANLSFFPLGHIFRRCGAFFIKRSFKGNRLYAFCLSHYIRKLIKDGHSLEFFIEGGRSRTGKVLPPRFGILSNIVDTVLSGSARNVILVPVSLSYDRIIEAGSYTAEISGVEKKSENVTGVLKSAAILDSHYGTIYISGGRPIDLTEFIDESGMAGRELSADERRYLIRRLGYSLLRQIDQASVVTPSALLATAFLTHLRRGMSYSRLCQRVGFLVRYVKDRRGTLSLSIERALKAGASEIGLALGAVKETGEGEVDRVRGQAVWQALEGTLETFMSEGYVDSVMSEGERVFSVLPAKRIYMDYYRNSMLHLMLRESFISVSLLARSRKGPVTRQEIMEDMVFLSHLLKGEFIFRVGRIEDGLAAGLTALEGLGFIRREEDAVTVVTEHLEELVLFRNAVLPVLESYLICVRHLDLLRKKGSKTQKDLSRLVLDIARREYFEGEVTCAEAVSRINLGNAIAAFVQAGILVEMVTGPEAGKLRFPSPNAEYKAEEIKYQLQALIGTL